MADQNTLKLPPPGQMVDMGDFRLHAIVQGEGSPAVVFESGGGGFALQFSRILPAVAAFTRVVAYDRAGQAWSDASPRPRTPENLTGEMHTLLEKLEVPPPYVLVGHSLGGLIARIYAGRYPGDLAGLVLVDSSDVEQYSIFPSLDVITRQMKTGMNIMKVATRLGLGKALTKMSLKTSTRGLPAEDLDTFATISSTMKHYTASYDEMAQLPCYFGSQSQVPPDPGDIPTAVITAGRSVSGKQKFGGMTLDAFLLKHLEWQKALAARARHGEHTVIEGATHLSVLTQEEYASQVVGVIRRMAEGERRGDAE
jgi:pimeloyl-ACP methyl ester carboxylesterase